MRSIELTFDDATDAAFRAAWTALADAGLPSLATHAGTTNRPHVTLAAGPALPLDPALATLAGRPPEVLLGGLTLFAASRGRFVLVRAVVVSAQLAAFHRAVHAVVPDALGQTLPDRWSPHVTLARRMTPTDLAVALPLLAEVPVPDAATVAGVRFWDGDAKQVTPLG